MTLPQDGRMVVRVSPRSRAALAERLVLLEETAAAVGQTCDLTYILDLNAYSVKMALACRLQRKPYVIDCGDDPYGIARAGGKNHRQAKAQQIAAIGALNGAQGVVYRGWFHRYMLLSQAVRPPLFWAPDTVDDAAMNVALPEVPSDHTLMSFGSVTQVRSAWPHTYGGEVLDLLREDSDLTALIVARGPAFGAVIDSAKGMGLASRIEFINGLPLEDLLGRMRRIPFVTSYQTDDTVGWSRTTGKLPLVLAGGGCLLTTRVGEAARVLPSDQTFPAERAAFVLGCLERMSSGWHAQDRMQARGLAETYRRSRVASSLGDWLSNLRMGDGAIAPPKGQSGP